MPASNANLGLEQRVTALEARVAALAEERKKPESKPPTVEEVCEAILSLPTKQARQAWEYLRDGQFSK